MKTIRPLSLLARAAFFLRDSLHKSVAITGLPVALLALASPTIVHSQGTVAFKNSIASKATIEMTNGSPRTDVPAGFGVRFGLFWGTSIDSMQLAFTAEMSATSAGLFDACTICPLDGTSPQQIVFMRIRAWSVEFGDDWQSASRTLGAYFGTTDTRSVTLGQTNGPGAVIWQGASGAGPNRFNPIIIRPVPNPTVELSMQGVGTVAKSPDLEDYDVGAEVIISATPGRWHKFDGWDDGVTNNPRTLIVTTSAVFTAVFEQTTPLEVLNFEGTNRLAPVGMPAFFVAGKYVGVTNAVERGPTSVLIQTSFSNGRIFYTLDGSMPDVTDLLYQTGRPISIRQTATLRAIAFNADFTQFAESDPLTIEILPRISTITKGGGRIVVEPSKGAYLSNGTAAVTAIPDPGWHFLHWLGDETSSNETAYVGMDRSKCVEAVFGTHFSISVSGAGEIAQFPTLPIYPFGTRVSLSALPESENYFVLWGGAANSTNTPYTHSITSPDAQITGVFGGSPPNQSTLAVIVNGFGAVAKSSRANRHVTGSAVTLTATAEEGQAFIGWSGDATGATNPLTVPVDGAMRITANFTKRPKLAFHQCFGSADSDFVKLLLSSEHGGEIVLERSTTGEDWDAIATITNALGRTQFNDLARPAALYRTRNIQP